MRFQLWRQVGKRTPAHTIGVAERLGQVTVELVTGTTKPTKKTKNVPAVGDEWAVLNLLATNRLPIVPGDFLISSGTGNRYKVMRVALNPNFSSETTSKYAWEVEVRKLQQYEVLAKYRDYTQCSRKRKQP